MNNIIKGHLAFCMYGQPKDDKIGIMLVPTKVIIQRAKDDKLLNQN